MANYRRLFGEVNAPGYGSLVLPIWNDAVYMKQYEHEQNWGRIGNADVLNRLVGVLATLKVIDPAVRVARVNNEVREEGEFIQGLKALWIRMGRNPALWPGARGEFNFGPNTNSSKDLRIHQDFYGLLSSPGTLWRKNEDGFVRLALWDRLYSGDVRDKLIASKYLDNSQPASTKDNSQMVKAIRNWYDEARALRLDVGRWPEGINFGSNVNGDEIRISDNLLTQILTQPSPRQIVGRRQTSEALRGATIRPPVIGTLRSTPVGFKSSAQIVAAIRSKGK
jgi:hypothetical protein